MAGQSRTDVAMAAYAALGFTTGSITDRQFAYLRSKGGTGSMDKMQRQLKTNQRVTEVFHPTEVP